MAFNSLSGVVFPSPRSNLTGATPGSVPSSFPFGTSNSSSTGRIQFPSPCQGAVDTVMTRYKSASLETSDHGLLASPIVYDECSEVPATSSWQQTVPNELSWASASTGAHCVQFSGLPNSLSKSSVSKNFGKISPKKGIKRHLDDEEFIGGKVFIHEDRMAAGMRGLQLHCSKPEVSGNGKSKKLRENQPWFVEETEVEVIDEELDDLGACSNKNITSSQPKLCFSPELEMSFKNKTIVPKLIRDEINKSQMQVVLWQSPAVKVEDLVKGASGEESTSVLDDSLENNTTLTVNASNESSWSQTSQNSRANFKTSVRVTNETPEIAFDSMDID